MNGYFIKLLKKTELLRMPWNYTSCKGNELKRHTLMHWVSGFSKFLLTTIFFSHYFYKLKELVCGTDIIHRCLSLINFLNASKIIQIEFLVELLI